MIQISQLWASVTDTKGHLMKVCDDRTANALFQTQMIVRMVI